jgi:hypothetical protein
MKVLFRILVILVVASLVGGAMFALVNVSGNGTQQRSFRRPEGSQFPQNNGGFRPDGERGRGDREGGRGGVLGLGFGLVKNLLVVAIIAIVYLNATKWFGKAMEENKQIEV